MTWREWFGIDKQEKTLAAEPAREVEVRFPAQPMTATGVLDPRSQTWIFVNAWAHEALQRAREKNDNMNRDIAQTSMLRGEIRILKELVNLPNPKTVKGLLEEE